MEYRLDRIGVLKLAIFSGIAYALMTAVFIVPFALIMIGGGAASEEFGGPGAAFGGVFMLFLPIAYGVAGFVGGAIAALIYNFVARLTGGIEFSVTPIQQIATPPTVPAPPAAPGGPIS